MEMNDYLARLIDSCSDAIISTDKDGNIVLFSERAEALLGYRAKDIAGLKHLGALRRFKRGHDRSRWRCAGGVARRPP